MVTFRQKAQVDIHSALISDTLSIHPAWLEKQNKILHIKIPFITPILFLIKI